MSVDLEKLSDLRHLLRKSYIEGYLQGTVDEGRGDFIGGAEERWEDSAFAVYLETLEAEAK